jgi:hypothetical protein
VNLGLPTSGASLPATTYDVRTGCSSRATRATGRTLFWIGKVDIRIHINILQVLVVFRLCNIASCSVGIVGRVELELPDNIAAPLGFSGSAAVPLELAILD